MKQFHAIIWKEDNLFVAKALEVEVASQGFAEKEALKNLQEALELYFDENSDIEVATVKNPKLQDLSIQVNA